MKAIMIVIVVLFVGTALPAAAQERAFAAGSSAASREPATITSARELYASARYDEALAVLNGLLTAERTARGELKIIEQYRSFCLLALGRTEEAQSAIASVVTADPFYMPSEQDVAPRVRSMFADVRQRLLPELAARRYAAAKRAYDLKEHAEAERQFRELVVLLDDPQMLGRMSDLRVLAAGFLELAAAAAAPPTAEPEPAPAEPEPPAPAVDRVYTSEEPGIVPPDVIRQELPPVPSAIFTQTKPQGLLEVLIDDQGRVAGMTLRSGVHPIYDTMLLNAVREWKYRPATLNAVPVQFRKLIQFNVRR